MRISLFLEKVKFSLSLMKHHAMNKYWGMYAHLHPFLTAVLDGGDWYHILVGNPGRGRQLHCGILLCDDGHGRPIF